MNGAYTYCHCLCDQLARRSHEVTVLCHPDGWLRSQYGSGLAARMESTNVDGRPETREDSDAQNPQSMVASNPWAVSVAESDFSKSPFQIARLARWVRRAGFDVLHTHNTRAHNIGVLLHWLTRVPVIATAHSQSVQLHWRFNTFVIANSESTLRYHRKYNRILSSRSQAVYCFTDLNRFRSVDAATMQKTAEELAMKPETFKIGIVGTVEARKNTLDLIRAVALVRDKLPDSRLYIVGPHDASTPYVRDVCAAIQALDLSASIQWLGARKDVPALMHLLDVIAVPSRSEPLGLVAVEAMAAGTAVIANRVGGLPEIVRHKETGLLVTLGQVKELADALLAIGQDDALRHQLGKAGQGFVCERFLPSRLTEQIESIYASIATRGQR